MCKTGGLFRSGSSCADHINTLQVIIEQNAEYNTDFLVVFVGFMKAFDCVSWDFISAVLRQRSMPDKIISLIGM